MDVKTFGLIFLGSILIQASIFGVVADKVPDKDGEVTKQGKEGNHLEEAAAVRAQSLNNVILKKRWTREENEKKKISKKSVIEEIPHLDDLSDLTDEINDRFATVEKRLAALEKQPPEPITPTLIDPITSKPDLGKTFVLGQTWDGETWDDAREACKKKGGDLASNLSKKDLKRIFNQSEAIVPNDPRIAMWIGIRMNERATWENYTDSYEWLDGTRISATDPLWGKYYPDDEWPIEFSWKCVLLYREHKYHAEVGGSGPAYSSTYCFNRWPFLCEIPKKRY